MAGHIPTRINLNTATREELMGVEGLRAEDADFIIRYREEHGGIQDVHELDGYLESVGAFTDRVHNRLAI